MKTVERKAEWTTSTGLAVVITATLQLSREAFCDGYQTQIACCERYLSAKVQGMGEVGSMLRIAATPQTINGRVLVAHIGKLGLTAEQLAMVKEIEQEITDQPEWQERLAVIERNRKSAAAQAESDRETGKCPSCGTWCYGGCR